MPSETPRLVDPLPLNEKAALVTGAASRVGRAKAMASAGTGADVFVHYGHSEGGASDTKQQSITMGRRAWMLQADHFPYTVGKAALAGMTRSLAAAHPRLP